MLYSLLLLYIQVEDYQNLLKLDIFLKKVSLLYFLHDFWEKIFHPLYSTNWRILIVWLPLFLEMSGNMCIVIIYFPVYDVINFDINHSFLIKPFFK